MRRLIVLGTFTWFACAGDAGALTPPPPPSCPELVQALQDATRAKGLALALENTLAGIRDYDAFCLGHELQGDGAAAYAPVLADLIRNSRSSPVRANAAAMLKPLTGPTLPLVQALTAALAREKDGMVAAAIMEVFGVWGYRLDTVEWSSTFTSVQVVEAISLWPGPAAPRPARQVQQARMVALQAIVTGYQTAHLRRPKPADRTGPPRPNAVLRDRELPSTWATIFRGALQSVDDPAALDLLASLAEYHLDAAGPALQRAFADTLIPLAGNPDARTRARAVRALAAAVNPWVDAEASPAGAAPRTPAAALDPAIVARLQVAFHQSLTDPDEHVRNQAVRGIGALLRQYPANVHDLSKALSDGSVLVRFHAARALASLPRVPHDTVIVLQRMAERGTIDAYAAILALENDGSPETIATLSRLLGKPKPAARERPTSIDEEFRVNVDPDIRYEGHDLLDLSGAAYRALRKAGKPAALPLLAHLAATRSDDERKQLLETLQAIGWQAGVTQSEQLVAALAPALASKEAPVRAAALSLLADWPMDAGRPYPDRIAESAARDYFTIPRGKPTVRPVSTNTMFFYDGMPTSDPQVDAVAVIGNSTSTKAAGMLVQWMCSGRRLQTASVRNIVLGGGEEPDGQVASIRASLQQMGNAAAAPVIDTLAKGAGKYCEDVLFDVLWKLDLDGSDAALVEHIRTRLDTRTPTLRPQLLQKLAHMPDLPASAVAFLLPIANHARSPEEAALALVALHNVATPPRPAVRDWPAQARFDEALKMPSSGSFKEPRKGRSYYVMPAADVAKMQADLRTTGAALRKNAGATPDAWIAFATLCMALDHDGRPGAPVLLKGLQHPSPQVREASARALGFTGAPEALPVLKAVRADPQSRLGRSVRLAVRRIELANPH